MQRLTLQVYELFEEFDRSTRHVAFFTKVEDAQKAKGSQVFFSIIKKNLDIKVFESFEEYENSKKDLLKEQALAKLSSEEKAALGLE